jgi:hydrogenase/urease accessory protein HupE
MGGWGRRLVLARRAVVLLAALLLAAWPLAAPLRAHELLPALLELNETAPGRVEVLWQRPLTQGQPLPLTPTFPADCRPLGEPRQSLGPRSLVVRSTLQCRQGLVGRSLEIDGLPASATEVLLRWKASGGGWRTEVIRPAEPRATLAAAPRSGRPPALPVYLGLGVEHILLGPDHLLFVLGLLLIVRGRRRLLKTVTAFTVAHSLTLAAATLGVLTLPTPPLEAAIAFSILFLGPEIVRSWRGQSSLTIRHPWVVAFLFGLLHGAGLAGGLQRLGLPRGETLQALALFNVGVEIGQLAFIALVLLVAWLWRRRRLPTPLWLRQLPGYLVGSLGAYWAIERTVAMVVGP